MKRSKSKFKTALANLAAALLIFAATTACNTCLVPQDQKAGAVGIFKSSAFDPNEWQHVATIHGWAEDIEVCAEIVELLEQQEPGRYICRNLGGSSG